MFFVLWTPQLCPAMRREQPEEGEPIPHSAECKNLHQIIPWGAGALIQTDPGTLEWLFSRYQDFLAPQWDKAGKPAPKTTKLGTASPHSSPLDVSLFNI